MSAFSRIPKLYGSKRSPAAGSNPSQETTRDERGTDKSTPQSSGASVGRSKSLKLPRKQYVAGGLESSSTSRIESGRQHHRGTNGILREKDSSSSPGSSRASSPGNTMATDRINFTCSTEVSGTNSDISKSSSDNPFMRRRAQSFGPNVRKSGLHSNRGHLRPPNHWSRETTPTSLSRGGTPTPRSATPSSLPVPSARKLGGRRVDMSGTRSGNVTPTPSHGRHVRSKSSLGNISGVAMMTAEVSGHRPLSRKPATSRVRRTESGDVIDGRGGVMGGASSRGRRPNSYIMNEPTADLNQLAKEITSSLSENSPSLNSPEIKSVSRIHSGNNVGVVSSVSHTPSSSGYTRDNSSSSSKSSEKHAGSLGRGTRYNFSKRTSPPTSGTRNRTSHIPPRGTLNSRSSTPSSGRSTPVGVGSLPGETTPAGSRLPAPSKMRSTQRKVIRVREARPVGINELEGAVLMDSDEYLKISHEVKALKTAILKLKRELQSGGGGGAGRGDSNTPGRNRSLASVGDSETSENERSKVVEENENLKVKLKTVTEKLDKMTSDLQRSESEKKKLNEELQQIEQHRSQLLDKVERLHADKNKLEDRLSSLRKAQLYEESSSSWVEGGEGGGGEGKWEDTGLMLAGVKGEKTESDIGESSDPESSAVCSNTAAANAAAGGTINIQS